MAISTDLGRAQLDSIVESTGTPGQPGVVVLNPDGSNISGGGGGGGDASAANQTTEIARLTSILSTQTDGTQKTILTDGTDDANVTLAGELQVLASAQPGIDIGDVTINNAAGASAVNIQDGGNSITVDGSITANLGTIGDVATQTTLSTLNAKVTAVDTGAVTVASSALPSGASTSALQTTGNTSLSSIDGKITACNTGAVVVSSSALPSGAATEVTLLAVDTGLSDGSQKTQLVDSLGNVIGATANALDVNIASGVTLTTDISQADDSIVVYGNDGTTNRVLKTDASGELQIDVLSSALPSGASTEATLSTLNGKVTACNTGAVVVASGTITANLGTIADVATQTTLSALNAKVTTCDTGNVSGTVTANIGTIADLATQTTLSALNTKVVACDTGAVTISNAAGASAVNIQDGGNSITVDGSVTANIGTIADLATQTTLSALNVKFNSGGGVEAGAVRVTLASDSTGLISVDDNGGSLTVDGAVSITALTSTHAGTTTTIGDSATSTTLLAANTARSGAAIRNNSSARLYIEQSSTATTSSVDYLDTGDVYELPILAAGEVYRGIITGIWASDAGGSAYVRENV